MEGRGSGGVAGSPDKALANATPIAIAIAAAIAGAATAIWAAQTGARGIVTGCPWRKIFTRVAACVCVFFF